jgi:hypothetical protein
MVVRTFLRGSEITGGDLADTEYSLYFCREMSFFPELKKITASAGKWPEIAFTGNK